jgi:threonine/homoserine/homoserine lactone efflux protein
LSRWLKERIFFIAFVPQFIRADAALVPLFAILIVTFVLATVNVLVYALLADPPTHNHTQTVDTGLDDPHRGGVLIAMGVLTADAAQSTNESRIFPRR